VGHQIGLLPAGDVVGGGLPFSLASTGLSTGTIGVGATLRLLASEEGGVGLFASAEKENYLSRQIFQKMDNPNNDPFLKSCPQRGTCWGAGRVKQGKIGHSQTIVMWGYGVAVLFIKKVPVLVGGV
jgi:hypothetical protein